MQNVEYGNYPDHEIKSSKGKYASLLKDFLANHTEPSMKIVCDSKKEMNLVACSLRQLRARLNANVQISTCGSVPAVFVTKYV